MDKEQQHYNRVSLNYSGLAKSGKFKGQLSSSGTSSITRLTEVLRKYYTPEMRVLELACGTGRATIQVAKFINDFHAIDISEDSILEAKEILQQMNLKGIKLQTMDVTRMLFSDSSFDLVFTHLPSFNLELGLKGIKRIIAPGGYFILSQSGEKHMLETGKIHKNYTSSLSEKLFKKYNFTLLDKYEDFQKIIFDTEENRLNLVKMPYGHSSQIKDMIINLRKYRDQSNYPLTLHKLTYVLGK